MQSPYSERRGNLGSLNLVMMGGPWRSDDERKAAVSDYAGVESLPEVNVCYQKETTQN